MHKSLSFNLISIVYLIFLFQNPVWHFFVLITLAQISSIINYQQNRHTSRTRFPMLVFIIWRHERDKTQNNFSFLVTCGNPPDVPDSTHTETGVNVNEKATYTCNSGYAISGQRGNTSEVTCAADGNWATIPSCVGKRHFIPRCKYLEVFNDHSLIFM